MIFTGNTFSILMLDEGIAELRFNAADTPFNIFTAAAVAGLSGAIDALEAETNLKGVIISSAKSGFCAGADITEFEALFEAGPEVIIASVSRNIRNYNRIEGLSVPVVAAVNGMALGGGGDMTTLHVQNFFETIRGKAKPNAPIDEGAKSTLLCHLANIAYRTNETLTLNSDTGQVKEAAAKKLWSREYQAGWEPRV